VQALLGVVVAEQLLGQLLAVDAGPVSRRSISRVDAGGGACGDGLGVGVGEAGAGLGAVDGVGVVDVVVMVGVGELAAPPPPSGMATCPSISTKETGLAPAREYRFWVSGSVDRPRLDSAPK
jgi:hypothetical protein